MILVLDNYDSFVYTLAGYLNHFGANTKIFRNDALSESELLALLDGDVPEISTSTCQRITGVLISPGPGTPSQAGHSKTLVAACAERGIPLLGVCLGHQAIAETFGATVDTAPELMHGKMSQVTHTGKSTIFENVPQTFLATRYHSLAVMKETMPEELKITAETGNGIIMALEHQTLPIWGVQFHPESFQTEHGETMLKNWLAQTG